MTTNHRAHDHANTKAERAACRRRAEAFRAEMGLKSLARCEKRVRVRGLDMPTYKQCSRTAVDGHFCTQHLPS